MEYQKVINLFDNTPNQPSKFRTRNCVETNDESRGTYDANNDIKFKTPTIIVARTIMLSWKLPSENIFCLFCFDNGYFKQAHRLIF